MTRSTIERLSVQSPKRSRAKASWEGFFPYYAGYPETFADAILASANLKPGSVVLDPWNGSGTTTYSAHRLGLTSIGYDINPVMVVVSRSRLLQASEADSLLPLARSVCLAIKSGWRASADDDELLAWFSRPTSVLLRSIEQQVRKLVVGTETLSMGDGHFDQISCIAATLYVAIFATARTLSAVFQSSNPTWIRIPKSDENKADAGVEQMLDLFLTHVSSMANALVSGPTPPLTPLPRKWSVGMADATDNAIEPCSVDFVLTSPPYCTRLDYTAATRTELAVLGPYLNISKAELGRRMIGSTKVPRTDIIPDNTWGKLCLSFLESVRCHTSKASSGYYWRTHLDYYDKMARSIDRISLSLKPSAIAVFVVQDSYYKELHNDVPAILSGIAEHRGLALVRAERFTPRTSMSRLNRNSRVYARPAVPTESVLCFIRE